MNAKNKPYKLSYKEKKPSKNKKIFLWWYFLFCQLNNQPEKNITDTERHPKILCEEILTTGHKTNKKDKTIHRRTLESTFAINQHLAF